MRAGRLDRRIALQSKSTTLSVSGAPVEVWSTFATRWASANPVRAEERFSAPQLIARQLTEFQIRWSSDIADLSPLDRVIFPPVAGTSPPTPIPSTSIYDVLEVHEIGCREGLKIIAARRADAS